MSFLLGTVSTPIALYGQEKKIIPGVETKIVAVNASDNPFNYPPDLDKKIRRGLKLLYNLKYDEGLAIFRSVEKYAEEYPMISFAIASAHWWRLSVLVLETDEKESQPFLDSIQTTIDVAKRKIEKGDTTGEAHLALGGILGIWGRFEATNHNWMSAYFKGKKAYKILRKAHEINKDVHDVKMGMGIFDYYVAALPSVVRVLAFLGMGGDKEVGLRELHEAAEKGIYSSTPSKLFLIDIYTRGENRPDKSLEILGQLKEEYPQSPFVHILEIIAYYNHGSIERLKEIAGECERFVKEGIYDSHFATQAHFAHGITFFKQRMWKEALSEFNKAIEVGYTIDAFHSWSHLYRGYTYDVLGERKKAKENYKAVLKQLRRWESWKNAKKRLSKPFTGTDEEISTLTL